MYQVLSGLSEGERIVTSGQFMLDSESQLREAIQEMLKPNQPGESTNVIAEHAGHTQMVATVQSAESRPAGAVKYICPMPEHVSIEYSQAGKCSLCGMVLVPVTQAVLSKLQPGGKLLYYTCPHA